MLRHYISSKPKYSLGYKKTTSGYTRKSLKFIDYWHKGLFPKRLKNYNLLNKESSGKSYIQSILSDVENDIFPSGSKRRRIADNLANCGSNRPWHCSDEGCLPGDTRKLFKTYCGHRICSNERCIQKRDRVLMKKYEPKLNNFNDPRFLTLTLKGYHPLEKVVHQRLNYAWKRLSLLLRKSGYIKAYIKVTELVSHEYVDAAGEYQEVYFWHLHVIYDGIYIAADVLRSAWEQFTKDSKWVHISRVKRNLSAMAYLRKYLTKMVYDSLDMDEYYKVFKMKLISHWNCRDEVETLLELSVLTKPMTCEYCGSRMVPDMLSYAKH